MVRLAQTLKLMLEHESDDRQQQRPWRGTWKQGKSVSCSSASAPEEQEPKVNAKAAGG